MNVNTNDGNDKDEEDIFCVESIVVPYFNVEITHANDNRAPKIVTIKKVVVWLLLVCLLAGIFYIN